MRRLLGWGCLARWHWNLLFARRARAGDPGELSDADIEQLTRDALTDVRMRAMLDRDLRRAP